MTSEESSLQLPWEDHLDSEWSIPQSAGSKYDLFLVTPLQATMLKVAVGGAYAIVVLGIICNMIVYIYIYLFISIFRYPGH